MKRDASNSQRVDKCDAVLRQYSDDGVFSNLVDILADAMHWADATGENFHYAICLAGTTSPNSTASQPTKGD